MQTEKYGCIEKGELILEESASESYLKEKSIAEGTKPETKSGYKPVEYAEIPEFDQESQAVYQAQAVDAGDKIAVGVVVVDIEQDEKPGEEIELPPVKEEPVEPIKKG